MQIAVDRARDVALVVDAPVRARHGPRAGRGPRGAPPASRRRPAGPGRPEHGAAAANATPRRVSATVADRLAGLTARMLAAGRRAGYAPVDDPALADARAALPRAGRAVRLGAAAQPGPAGHDPRGTRRRHGCRRAPARRRSRRGATAWRRSSRSTSSRSAARSARCRRAAAADGGSARARSGPSSKSIAADRREATTPSTPCGRATRASRSAAGAAASGRPRRRSRRASPRSRPTTGERSLTDPDPEQGYVHEWLHQVESVYRALGVSEDDLPPLHDAGGIHLGAAA